ncbi:MAG TPA: MarR family transcriptional regulator [Gemmatimonadales bacterium]|nr:MarR family transcriptional regulator [Gemmatimonadales bacterium]
MSPVKPSRRQQRLRAALADAVRRHSTATVLFHAAIAERLGLNPTDHKAADLIIQRGPLSAGELATLTGLTTGAVTGIIDRLEAAGWVRRARDPADRRRVIVTLALTGEPMRRVAAVFEPAARALAHALDGYSEAELATLLDFVERSRALVEQEALRLRGGRARP